MLCPCFDWWELSSRSACLAVARRSWLLDDILKFLTLPFWSMNLTVCLNACVMD